MRASPVMHFAGRRGVYLVAAVVSLALSISAQPAFQRDARGAEYVPGVVIVKVASTESSAPTHQGLAPTGNFEGVSTLYGVWKSESLFPESEETARRKASMETPAEGPVLRLSIQNPAKTLEAAAAFAALPEVEYAEPLYVARLCIIPDDPQFSQQWYLNNTGQYRLADADIDAVEAWDITIGDPSVAVAVIDSGVDFTHEDLADQSWANPVEQAGDANGDGRPGLAGYDDDGDGLIDEDSAGRQPGDSGYTNDLVDDDDENGYPDDLVGWNWTGSGAGADVSDGQGHGTHIAGTIAAQADNSLGIAGVAPGCRVMALKAFGPDGSSTTDNLAKAIDYARRMDARVINMSFTLAADSQLLRDTLAQAYSRAVLVAAAGNDGPLGGAQYPAAYSFVVGVGASDVYSGGLSGAYETPASFSNVVSADLFAPGVSILSTLPGNDYAAWSGTSMAAPLVSGVAALVASHWKDQPGWGADLITGQILSTGDTISGMRRLNALSALSANPETVLEFVSSAVNDPSPGNENGIPNPGETIEVVVTLKNGWAAATGVAATLATSDSLATIVKGNSDFGSIGSQASDSNDSDPFLVTINSAAPNNHEIQLDFMATAANGERPTTTTITLRVSRGEEIGGILSGDVRWTSGTYYIVRSPVLIPEGSTLTIGPGTTLYFDPDARLRVEGSILARGTRDAPILFTINDPNPHPGLRWGGNQVEGAIQLYHSGKGCAAQMEYCIIEYANRPVHATGLDIHISHCTVRSCYDGIQLMDNGTTGTSVSTVRFCIIHDTTGNALEGRSSIFETNLIYRAMTGIDVQPSFWPIDSVVTRCNTVILNQYYGFKLMGPTLADRNMICGNRVYDALAAESGTNIELRNCFWGTTSTLEIDSKIFDYNDDFTPGRPVVQYQPILTEPPEEAPPILWKIETEPAGTVQSAGTTTFTLTFSGDMSTTKPLFVSYGPADPFTQHAVQGRWISNRVWEGTTVISMFTGDGNHTLRVDGAESLMGFPALAIRPFEFEVRTTGLSGVALQASGEKGQVRLFWNATDINDLAGYNVYRSDSAAGAYQRLNPTVFVDTTYTDLTAPEGITQYYQVAAVRTDFSESQRSDPASAAAQDATSPTIQHAPPQSPIVIPVPGVTIQARVQDNVGVQGVTIYWRTGGQVDWKSAAMPHVTGDLYSYNIPGDDVTEDGLDYYITATDSELNMGAWPAPDSYLHVTATSDLHGLILSIILGAENSVSPADVNQDGAVDAADLIENLR